MNIKVIIDFEIIGNYKKDQKDFYENLEILKKISQIYQTDLFISPNDIKIFNSLNVNNINIYLKENKKDEEHLVEVSDKYDWILYFKSGTKEVLCEGNIIYSPIKLKGNIDNFKNISFTEHAKNKKYYHDFSNYYMETLANDTKKEAQFLIDIFKKYLNKDTGKVIDCCCGVGRHAYLLAKDGFKVTGIDISSDQIANAKKIHNHSNIDYKIMDIRDFDLIDKDYEMSYCMWTTYNYLSLDKDLKKFIKSNYNHQKKGSILVLDSKNIPRLDAHRMYHRYTEKDKFKMDILINKYVFNNIQNSQYFLFINDNGYKKFFYDDEFVRFYTINELKKIIGDYYEIIDIYGNFDMEKYNDKTSNRFITVLKRI